MYDIKSKFNAAIQLTEPKMNSKITLWFNHSISSLDVILRTIRSHPILSDCRIIVTNRFEISNLIPMCDVYQVEPNMLHTSDYVSWCQQFAEDNEVDVFFPQRNAEHILLHHDVFEAFGTQVVMHTGLFEPHLIESKTWVYGDLEASGFSEVLPELWKATTSLNSVSDLIESYQKPLCIKPDRGIYGEGFFVIHKGSGLNITQSPPSVGLDTLQHVYPYLYQNKPCIVSEYLPGKEYSIDCAFDRGVILSAVIRVKSSRKYQRVFTLEDASTDTAKLLFHYVDRIGRTLSLNAWANMQFKENAAGAPIFLEVNPRFSGGLGISAMANPELPVVPILNALGIWQGKMNQYQNDGAGVTSMTEYSIL